MLYVKMDGRLGNQLFRYAAVRAYQLKYAVEEPICIDWNKIDELNQQDDTFYRALDDFNVVNTVPYRETGKLLLTKTTLPQRLVAIGYKLVGKRIKDIEMNRLIAYQEKWRHILNRYGLYVYRIGYAQFETSNVRNKIFDGTFEDPRYFQAIRSQLLQEFTPKQAPLAKNASLYEVIQQRQSVCLSVRRGDFESNPQYKALHSVCDQAYFERAIAMMKERVDNPVFILFSDDIEWTKTHIHTGVETYYEDGSDPVWEKLRLMSQCKHFILSNSSFSWWVQWLSQSEQKVVVAPTRWYNNDYQCPLIEDSFITV